MTNLPQREVYIVDDDIDIRDALQGLLVSVGLKVRCFASVEELLSLARVQDAGCLVLDVRLVGQSGLSFQRQLVKDGAKVSIVFISGHGDIPMAVRAIKDGAVEFLTKPLRSQDLIDAIHVGLERDRDHRSKDETTKQYREIYQHDLTPREREVMALIVAGDGNKQAAFKLGISETTVKIHRSQVMRKLDVKTLPDLVRLAADLESLDTSH